VPEKIAPFVVALASDAGAKVTGQIFGVRKHEIFLFFAAAPDPQRPYGGRLDAQRPSPNGSSPCSKPTFSRWRAPATSSPGIRSEPWRSTRNACSIIALPTSGISYVARDAILYALGLGLGADPLDEKDLPYLLEDRLKVLPTMAVTLASPGLWVKEPALGINWVKLVHSAQEAEFFAPLPVKADVVGSARIASLHDRGAERGRCGRR